MGKRTPLTKPKPGNLFLSADQVANRYNVHRASIYRWAKEADFPKPIKLGDNCTRWSLEDIEAWEQMKKDSR